MAQISSNTKCAVFTLLTIFALAFSGCASIKPKKSVVSNADKVSIQSTEQSMFDEKAAPIPDAGKQTEIINKSEPVNHQPESESTAKSSKSRINPLHSYVNVRKAASAGGRPIAVLKGGKLIEVVDEEDRWVKIRWKRGNKLKEGWVVKKFVEGVE